MPEILQSPSHQHLGAPSNHAAAAEPKDSTTELLHCIICTHKYDCDTAPHVPRMLPVCGHTFCAGCIDNLAADAQRQALDGFLCPLCKFKQPVDQTCPTNWVLKSHITSLRNKLKRKRPAPPAAPPVEASTCARHTDAQAEILCVNCAELTCIRCAFECAQQQHKCVKADAIQLAAASQSSSAIDAAFERGQQKIRARLDEEIRASHAAAARLNLQLVELCERTKSSEDARVKAKMQCALWQRDARGLVQLLQADATAPPLFDIDIQASDIILRSHRTITYDNGTRVNSQIDFLMLR